MTRSFTVNINPKLLLWAIERSGFTKELLVQYIRHKFNVKYFTNDYLENILEDKESTKYSDLKKIDSYLKRGIPFYFLDTVPEERIFPKFRSKFGNFVNPIIEQKLREYSELREEIQYLLQEQNISIQRKLPEYNLDFNPAEAAKIIRRTFNFDIKDYEDKTSREVFEILRMNIENQDIFIFRDALPHELRGCIFLDNKYPPLMLVNSSDDKNAEIFSLLHELGHYLLNMEDVDIDNINANNPSSSTEIWCNSFAYFLLITEEIEKKEGIKDSKIEEKVSDQWLKELSKKYKLSKLAFMYRLYLMKAISKNDFNDYLKKHSYKKTIKSQGGPDYYKVLKTRLSKKYIELINNNYSDGRISLSETFDYLKVRDVDRMNQLFEVLQNG